jgi:SWIM zinc finger
VAFDDQCESRIQGGQRLVAQARILGVEEDNGKIYVTVQSETPTKIDKHYKCCIYGEDTDIRCECLDFLARGGACKHLRAAAIHVNNLRLQEHYSHFPQITFISKHQAWLIRRKVPRTPGQQGIELDSEMAEHTIDDQPEDLNWAFESVSENGDKTGDHQQEEDETELNLSADGPSAEIVDLATLNSFILKPVNENEQTLIDNTITMTEQTAAVRDQHLTSLHNTTSANLHQLSDNLREYKRIAAPETEVLTSALEMLIESRAFINAIQEVSKFQNRIKRAPKANSFGYFDLDVEKKRPRIQSHSSF